MQPPSTNPSSPTSNNTNPYLGTACPPKRYTAPFAARIVQKSRRHGRQARENAVGFADLRARAGGEARFFQSLFEEISTVPLAVNDARHDFSPANRSEERRVGKECRSR